MTNPCNELKKAGRCLYATVPSDVADDVMSRITAVCDRHDKLVEMLKRLEFAGLDVDSEEECVCCVCGAMNWPKPQHTPNCTLAALLKEEKP